MVLVGFLILTLIFMATVRFSVLEIFQPWSIFFHKICLSRLPHESYSHAELQALVCGKNFVDASISDIYKSTGLIHLFVVSGAHLLLIEKILRHFFDPADKKNIWPLGLCLLIYAFCCNLNPPVTRSLIAMAIGLVTAENHLHWPENFKILVCGLLALIFQPFWITSISLQLSWLAALVVSVNSLYLSEKNILLKQSLFFIVLAPVLTIFQINNPKGNSINSRTGAKIKFINIVNGLGV